MGEKYVSGWAEFRSGAVTAEDLIAGLARLGRNVAIAKRNVGRARSADQCFEELITDHVEIAIGLADNLDADNPDEHALLRASLVVLGEMGDRRRLGEKGDRQIGAYLRSVCQETGTARGTLALLPLFRVGQNGWHPCVRAWYLADVDADVKEIADRCLGVQSSFQHLLWHIFTRSGREAGKLHKMGIRAAKRGDEESLDTAIFLLRKAIGCWPWEPAIYLDTAQALLDAGRNNQVAAEAEFGVQLSPFEPQIPARAATMFLELQDYAKAEYYADLCLTPSPGDMTGTDAFWTRGRAREALGKSSGACEDYRQVSELCQQRLRNNVIEVFGPSNQELEKLRVGAEITSHYSGQTYQPTRRLLPH